MTYKYHLQSHTYTHQDKPIPSVTGVIYKTDYTKLKGNFSTQATREGSIIHEILNDLLLMEIPIKDHDVYETLPETARIKLDTLAMFIFALKREYTDIRVVEDYCETPLFTSVDGNHFGGTIDLVLQSGNKYFIVDYKSSLRPTSSDIVKHLTQIGGYSILLKSVLKNFTHSTVIEGAVVYASGRAIPCDTNEFSAVFKMQLKMLTERIEQKKEDEDVF